MLEKLKQFAESMKSVLLYIATPLTLVLGVIYYLVTQNKSLKTELEVKDGESKLQEIEGEKKGIDSSAAAALSEYERLRRDYLSGSAGGVQHGGNEAGGSDRNSGSGSEPGPGYVKSADDGNSKS